MYSKMLNTANAETKMIFVAPPHAQQPLQGIQNPNTPSAKMFGLASYVPAPMTEEERQTHIKNLVGQLAKDLAPAERSLQTREKFQGLLLDNRYEILRFLGAGSYGNVYKANDVKGSQCAIKVIKTKHMHNKNVIRELEILDCISRLDPHNKFSYSVILHRVLMAHEHYFLIYELLGPTISEILACNNYKGFPLIQVRRIAHQLCSAMNFLHRNGLIHRDIKSDNVAFTTHGFYHDPTTGLKLMKRTYIKLIDFGSAIFAEHELDLVTATTRQFSAPEVGSSMQLSVKESCKSDVWSFGCTLYELHTGRFLFPCQKDEDKFYLIEKILDQEIPPAMGQHSGLDCFNSSGKLRGDLSPKFRQSLEKFKPLKEIEKNDEAKTENLWDLIKKTLIIDPEERIDSSEVLKHAFWK